MASSTLWTWVWVSSRSWNDREVWCAAVHGVTKSQTWLSDWTQLNCLKSHSPQHLLDRRSQASKVEMSTLVHQILWSGGRRASLEKEFLVSQAPPQLILKCDYLIFPLCFWINTQLTCGPVYIFVHPTATTGSGVMRQGFWDDREPSTREARAGGWALARQSENLCLSTNVGGLWSPGEPYGQPQPHIHIGAQALLQSTWGSAYSWCLPLHKHWRLITGHQEKSWWSYRWGWR